MELFNRLKKWPVAADAWGRAFAKLVDVVGEELDKIADLGADIASGAKDEKQAWAEYGAHFDLASSLCRDSVELLGGFALREQLVDEDEDRLLNRKVCEFVEAIVGECATGHPDLMPLLAIPAAEDPLAETQARIIRVRFPEWTVWTVPLAAHEYCRATFLDVSSLSRVVEHESARRARSANGAEDPAGIVPLLIADAFALRVMGPAYACAAVLLRLDPFVRASGSRTHDIERAETIFKVVETLYPDEDDIENEARRFIEKHVKSHWRAAVAAVAPEVDLGPIEKRAASFAEDGYDALDKKIYPEAHYVLDSSGGGNDWRTAEKLRKYWSYSLKDVGVGGKREDKPGKYGVRDVLNAAWSARLRIPKGLKSYAAEAARECEALLAAPPEPGGELRTQKGEPERAGVTKQ